MELRSADIMKRNSDIRMNKMLHSLNKMKITNDCIYPLREWNPGECTVNLKLRSLSTRYLHCKDKNGYINSHYLAMQ
jgi:hypothetical protein